MSRTWIVPGSLILVLHAFADQKRSEIADPGISATSKIEAQTLVSLLSQAHLSRAAVKPSDYAEIIGEFMASLDSARLVFLKSDKEELTERYGLTLEKDLRAGDLRGAIAVTERFRSRISGRAKWIQQALVQPFSETKGETYLCTQVEWPSDSAEADARWSKQLHAEIIDELLNGATPEQAQQVVSSRYETWRTRSTGRPLSVFVETFLDAVAKRYDSLSAFFGAETFAQFGTQPHDVGIGALLTEDRGRIYVGVVERRGPADKPDGLTAGDLVLKIRPPDAASVDVTGMRLNEVVALLRGKPGTEVRMVVHPANLCDPAWRRTVTLTRGAVDPAGSRAYGSLFLAPTAGEKTMPIGVVTLPAFYGELTLRTGTQTNASKDVAALVERFSNEQIAGLVLDLRGNGGGFLDQAISIAGLFVGHRVILRTRDYEGKESESVSPVRQPIFKGPLVILVDGRSASASEIVAGALRDYGRALVVGSRTHGNGIVQTVLEFRNLVPALARSRTASGAGKVTIQQFFLPNGNSPQLVGLEPDLALPVVDAASMAPKALHPIPAQKCPSFAKGAAKVPTDLVERLVEQSHTRQTTLDDLVAARTAADHSRSCEEKPYSLELATRGREMEDEHAMARQVHTHLAGSQGQMPSRLVFLDAKTAKLENGVVAPEAPDHTPIDPLLAETVRIVRDAVEAKWTPEFN